MNKFEAVIIILIIFFGAGYFVFREDANDRTASIPGETPENKQEESLPGFGVPEGFSLSIFAKDLPGARVIAFDDQGEMWVSLTGKGKIVKLDENKKPVTVLGDLNNPHGIAFDNSGNLYFAEENKISVLRKGETSAQKIADLPTKGGGHFTRTLGFGPDERLYVSIGSSCNVCHEEDPRRAAIYSMKTDGTDFKQFAKGLRNTVFFAWNPVDGKMWGTDMGRDNLGDNIPPDEINIITGHSAGPSTMSSGPNGSGQSSVPDFGWPIWYGKNIHDTQFDKNTYIRNPCMEPFETPSFIDLQAHSAPLGLSFIPEEGWPEEYW